ncbi:MAG: DNA primase, partial [Synergistaceae bacterium]|nr:DNA primase [Synergistaceae bacterium]
MAVSNEILEQIKNSLDISEIIGDRVKLRRSSRGYEGLCPFHDERTPSFHVYTDTQSYYCCG